MIYWRHHLTSIREAYTLPRHAFPMENRMETADQLTLPAAGLCVFVGFMPFAVSMSLHQSHLAAKQLLLVAGAAAFALLFAFSARTVPVTPLWWPIGLLATASALNAWKSPRVDSAASLFAALILFGASAWALDTRAARDRLADIVATTAAFEAAYILCQAFWFDPLFAPSALHGKWRSFGTFGNPNWAGEYLAMALVVTMGRLASAWSLARAAALALIAAGLAATFARGAWLACAIGMLAMLLTWRGRISRNRLIAVAAAALAGMVIVAILALRPDMFQYLANAASIRGRFWLWYVTVHMILAHPLGVGLGQFEVRFAEMQAHCFQTDFGRRFLSSASFPLQAHNDYLQIAAEAGVPALLAAVALAFLIVRRGRALSTDGAALGFWAAVVAMTVNALYAFPFFLPGSLALCAIFLGATEAGLASRRDLPPSRLLRLTVCTGVLAGVLMAWHWSWRFAASEYELHRANSAISRQSWDQAAAAIEKALYYDPHRLESHYLSGRLSLIREDYISANAAFDRAARLGYRAEVFTGRSAALWGADRGAEAIAELEKLLWLRPDEDAVRKRILRMRSLMTGSREAR